MIEGKKINAVDDDANAVEIAGNILRLDSFREEADIRFGVDAVHHLGHDLDLRPADGIYRCAELPIEVSKFEGVVVSQMKAADAHAGKCQKMESTDTPRSGDTDTCLPETTLVGLRNQANIALERLTIEISSRGRRHDGMWTGRM